MKDTSQVNAAISEIMIVDDEEGIRELFSVILETYLPGVHVEQACNGAEAVERFRDHKHRVLIMDLHMPVMDGWTAFGQIEESCPDVSTMPSVVFCTGYSPPESVRELVVKETRHQLLLKPVKPEDLVKAVQSRLSA